ncbi:hypothetical protein DWW00_22265 [Bacteroides fragilis]|uniref:Uncharacterized protein n=1 Tax=Bacteroides fragilis TaxID=817 RepID=A0A412XQ74_BACFG|nr:hypothetical protein DWW08_23000 [Bacteroides fragilis]RGV81834.1 hypothetical protein DWW00_22265 [Bacteroides fragilis]
MNKLAFLFLMQKGDTQTVVKDQAVLLRFRVELKYIPHPILLMDIHYQISLLTRHNLFFTI